ncbi:CCA tRNA nucleotidyltransferase [Salipaludibacillus sp. CF4.18]|uniref:CCA tRNA nucleotidyltransferase n=1 Tax=Salipaludibacillus sp. CF4.18 TaxID=3373081 RepID=UPI003EE4C1E6
MYTSHGASHIINTLKTAGYDAYIVGGAVRDQIIGRAIHDVDVITNASIDEIEASFSRVIKVGIQHGTILVPVTGTLPVEVSTYKGDTLEDDLRQRDFTVNAMAMSLTGDMIDPFNGQQDIKNKVLRTTADPSDVFSSDPLRLLRALRFAVHLQFKISEHTQRMMNDLYPLIHQSAVERVAMEMGKLSQVSLTNQDWDFLLNQKVFQELPYLFKHREIQYQLKSPAHRAKLTGDLAWWSVALYQKEIEIVKDGLRYYKLSNALSKDVRLIHELVSIFLESSWTSKDLYILGTERLHVALILINYLSECTVHSTFWLMHYNNLPIKHRKDLDVSGKELIQEFPEWKGSEIGERIRAVETAVLEAVIPNDKAEIYQWLRKET